MFAISADAFITGEATLGDTDFRASLAVSLTPGLLVVYPVTLDLIHVGVNEGEGDPPADGLGRGEPGPAAVTRTVGRAVPRPR